MTEHWYSCEQVGAKLRPLCSCGWRGRPSGNDDQARGQFASHTSREWAKTPEAIAMLAKVGRPSRSPVDPNG